MGLFVGGEFYYDQRWIVDAPSISTEGMYFLNGGSACLRIIADCLLERGIQRILLPTYLCPSIITSMERSGLAYDFYQIQEDLSIDLEDMARKMDPCQAVYVINYFGFSHAPETLNFLTKLRENGTIVIEDNAQAGFSKPTCGDFTFNSMRKLCPYDGGYLLAAQELSPTIQKYQGLPNQRLPVIREYRSRLLAYLSDGTGNHAELEQLFYTAERYYELEPVVLGDEQERKGIEGLDWKAIRQIRRENYQYLLGLIASIPEITPLFPALQAENMPLGLPVYLQKLSRDRVCEDLARAEIGLTIHWDEIASHPSTKNNFLAVKMAGQILTLAVDQRFNRRHMDYQALKLAGAAAAA